MNINQNGLHRLNTSGNLENPGYILTVVEPAAQFTDIHKTERKTNKQTKCNFESALNCWCISPS